MITDEERHEMQLSADYPTGACEWRCPRCGRRVVMQAGAAGTATRIIALEEGDAQIPHTASRTGVSTLRSVTARPAVADADRLPPGYRPH